ncbi:hypothetical protein C2E23DRAFT_851653 [Lenzites betulinus]|nr:hypothetical protein C2E23DRAFT_851653 [Lenzites betulinus]
MSNIQYPIRTRSQQSSRALESGSPCPRSTNRGPSTLRRRRRIVSPTRYRPVARPHHIWQPPPPACAAPHSRCARPACAAAK